MDIEDIKSPPYGVRGCLQRSRSSENGSNNVNKLSALANTQISNARKGNDSDSFNKCFITFCKKIECQRNTIWNYSISQIDDFWVSIASDKLVISKNCVVSKNSIIAHSNHQPETPKPNPRGTEGTQYMAEDPYPFQHNVRTLAGKQKIYSAWSYHRHVPTCFG